MRKVIKVVLCLLFILLFVSGCKDEDEKASLEVGNSQITSYVDISMDELNSMINNDESFVLFVYSPTCGACNRFKVILEDVIKNKQVVIYAIT